MRQTATYILLMTLVVLTGCSRPGKQERKEQTAMQADSDFAVAGRHLIIDMLLPTTPVKNQGRTDLCWIYALLATIETNQLVKGDSVNLSPLWMERKAVEEAAQRCYLTGDKISLRGTLMEALRLYSTYGIVPYDSYHTVEGGTMEQSAANTRVLARKVTNMCGVFRQQRKGLSALSAAIGDMLDDDLGAAPLAVYMLGARYTMRQFAYSCTLPEQWKAYTSFTHHPFGEDFAVEVPDNSSRLTAMNIPIGTMTSIVTESLRHRHPVAWEGKMRSYDSDSGSKDKAGRDLYGNDVSSDCLRVLQQERQMAFERGILTDDHCMAIVGLAHDTSGRKYFIMKNSWGVHDGSSGFRFMTFREFMLNTVIIMATTNQ